MKKWNKYNLFELTWDEWVEQFKPLKDAWGNILTVDNYEFLKAQNPLTIWTEKEGDEGGLFIENGFHFINRIGYYVTEIPFEKGWTYNVILEGAFLDEDEYEDSDENE